ncbi:hypothetical protein G7046_g5104 [Stylonectria norvegica]|nr:hypothetical protein G7046_g5104 [Stylonectria norvegica]
MAFPDEPVAHLLGSNGPVHAVTYSASPGTYILTGSADRSIRLYNPFPSTTVPEIKPKGIKPATPQGRLIQTYAAHGYEVLSLAVAADNQRFVSGGGDRNVFLWDVATAVTTRRFWRQRARPHCKGQLRRLRRRATPSRAWPSGAPKSSPGVSTAACAATTCAWAGGTTDVIGASVTSLSLTRDGRAVLVGSLDSKLRLMDRDNGTCLRAYADPGWKNEELRVQALLGGREKYVVAGDEMVGGDAAGSGQGRIWAWDLLTGRLVAKVQVPWGPEGYEPRKKVVGRDGKEKARSNVLSCMAWREDGWGDQFCVGGTSGVVTVFGAL